MMTVNFYTSVARYARDCGFLQVSACELVSTTFPLSVASRVVIVYVAAVLLEANNRVLVVVLYNHLIICAECDGRIGVKSEMVVLDQTGLSV